MRAKRFLVVSQYFRPEVFRVNDLVDWLQDRGHEVVVLTGLPNYPSGRFFPGYTVSGPFKEVYGRVTVVRAPIIPRGSGSGFRLALNYLSFAVSACVVGLFRCRGKFDAIFVHEPSPITVGIPSALMRWATRAPVFFWVLDVWPENAEATGAVRSGWAISGLHSLTAWVYRHCDWILMQSRAFTGCIARYGIETARLLYFPNWAEPAVSGGTAGVSVGLPVELPQGFRIMFTGNMGESQGLDVLLDAAELLHQDTDIQWILVGGGRSIDWIRSEVQRRNLGSCVHVPGAFPPDTMPAFFGAADALLVTLRDQPVFALTVPAKVQAYLAAGRPIIASLNGEGARIIQESGAGLVAPAGDALALAKRVLELKSMPIEQRKEMGDRGRDYSRAEFDRDVLLCRLEGWLAGQGLPSGSVLEDV